MEEDFLLTPEAKSRIMSDQQPENKLSQAHDLADVDIYCLHCGYNVRGLSGDPRRCPECGNMIPLGLTDVPEHLVKRQLRLMNMQAILMPLSLCVVAVFGVIGIGMMCDKFGRESGVVLTLVAVAALGFLVWCVREFRSDCGSQPG